MKYPPTPLDAEALRCASTKASEVIRQKRNPPEHQYFGKCIIEPRSPHSSTGTARGLLRRRIKVIPPTGKPVVMRH
jgi:hypothetical protein